MRPLYPAAGPLALHPVCDAGVLSKQRIPHEAYKDRCFGHHENDKKRLREKFLPPLFSFSPDALHPADGNGLPSCPINILLPYYLLSPFIYQEKCEEIQFTQSSSRFPEKPQNTINSSF